MTKEEKIKLILAKLYKIYPHPKTALIFETPWQLLVATILSAQTTDKTVNTVTPELFKKYKDIKDYASVPQEDLDLMIKKINFHTNKAKSIISAAKMIGDKFGGKVPESMEDLDSLPGVARKTANVVLGNSFKKAEGIVVDTHVMRLTTKLGLTANKDPKKIEQDLMGIVPKENWVDFSHLLISHGRDICTARPHSCNDCPLEELCPDHKP